MPNPLRVPALAAALLLAPLAASAQEVYFNDFDGAEVFGSGVAGGLSGETATESVQGYAGLGPLGEEFAGDMLRNTSATQPGASTVLTLSGLPSHATVRIEFLLAVIDSWDGEVAPGVEDLFDVWLDGAPIFEESFRNSTLGTPQSYAGPALALRTPLGFGTGGDFDDSAYDMAPNFLGIPHTADTLTLEFFASGGHWQGGDDESWGMDNLRVTVPEPSRIAQLLVGAAVLVAGLALGRARERLSS